MTTEMKPYTVGAELFRAVKLTPDNMGWVSQAVQGSLLYTNGQPTSLAVGSDQEAYPGDVVVEKQPDGELLVVDIETFDFFFNPQS